MPTRALRALACEEALEASVRDATRGGRVALALALLERARAEGALEPEALARWSRIAAHAYKIPVDPPLTEDELRRLAEIALPRVLSETKLQTDSERFASGHARVWTNRLDLDLYSADALGIGDAHAIAVQDPGGTEYLVVSVALGHGVKLHLRPNWKTPAMPPSLIVNGVLDRPVTVRPA